jgi:uroporphyrinogen-III synthase
LHDLKDAGAEFSRQLPNVNILKGFPCAHGLFGVRCLLFVVPFDYAQGRCCSLRQAGFDRLTSTSSVTAATTVTALRRFGILRDSHLIISSTREVFVVPFDYAQGRCCSLRQAGFDRLTSTSSVTAATAVTALRRFGILRNSHLIISLTGDVFDFFCCRRLFS